MTRFRTQLALGVYAAALAIGGGATFAADRPLGPPLGKVRYRTTIEPGRQGADTEDRADTDDYVGTLVAGEQLNAKVSTNANSALFPTLQLLDPDGVDRTPELTSRNIGKSLSFRKFVIDKTGDWVVRVGGRIGTGVYTVAFNVKRAPPLALNGVAVGGVGDNPLSVGFEGVEGAEATFAVKWRKRDSPVSVTSLRDPAGNEVPGEGGSAAGKAVTKRRRTTLKRAVLSAGSGTYLLGLGVASGSATASVRVQVDARNRPRKGRLVRLSADEPTLDPVDSPLRGARGTTLTIRGLNLAVEGVPTVLFGGVPGDEVFVNPTGTSLTVNPPEGVEDTTVSLAVVAPSGQASRLDDAFYYVPTPTFTALTDRQGRPIGGASSAGGVLVRIEGTFFQTGLVVNFGPSPDVIPLLLSDGLLELRVPPGVDGVVQVTGKDSFGHEAILPAPFEYKQAPSHESEPYDPPIAEAHAETEILVTGSGFGPLDDLQIDGQPVQYTFLSEEQIRFTAANLEPGPHTVELVDRVGTRVEFPALTAKAPPEITGTEVDFEPAVGEARVPVGGGGIVTVSGTGFDPSDIVSLGGSVVQIGGRSGGSFQFTVPAGVPGDAQLRIEDLFGNVTTADAVVRYVGYVDATDDRSPGGSDIDSLTASRGASADLDGDGDSDDLVITSTASAGTRVERTRIFFGDADGVLVDATDDDFPAGSALDGEDDWNGTAVALGDIDDDVDASTDIVLGGASPDAYETSDIRFFVNDGVGGFTLDEDIAPPPTYRAAIDGEDENAAVVYITDARVPQGRPTAIAIGDLDDDGDLDVVVGRDSYEYVYTHVDPAAVDFTADPPYVSSADAVTYALGEYVYRSATHVLENDLDGSGAFLDVTDASLPGVGSESDFSVPAFHAEDIALGDVDDDGDLDLVVTWSDPTTVTAYGLYSGSGVDAERVATRILINDGYGVFTDETDDWLPAGGAGGSLEYWQGHRVVLQDIDGDDLPELFLLLEDALDGHQPGAPDYTDSALRVLRNGGTDDGFVDVTATAIPPRVALRDDNWRGTSLRITDVDGDGRLDLLVSTDQELETFAGERLRSTRLLLGRDELTFVAASEFLPGPDDESGEASELVLIGDLAGTGDASLVLLGSDAPVNGPGSERLRVLDWER